jgi:hypothetical protein
MLRDDDRDVTIRAGLLGPGEEPGPQLTRKIIIGIEQHEESPLVAYLPCHEVDGALELLLLDELPPGHAIGGKYIRVERCSQLLQHPSQEDGN